MGGCSSKSAVREHRVPPEAQARRLVRQTTSQAELQRQLDEYHSRRRASPKYEKFRPAPIPIENPAGPGSVPPQSQQHATPPALSMSMGSVESLGASSHSPSE